MTAPQLQNPIAQSRTFNATHRIDEREAVLFGYKDGGRHMQFASDGTPKGRAVREIIVAQHPSQDPILKAAIETAMAAAESLPNRLAKADHIASYVADLLKEGNEHRNTDILTQLAGERGLAGTEITLGQMIEARTGVCRHRSLLFKIIADTCGIPCGLVRGNYDLPAANISGGHAWNEVVLENGECIIVDVMNNFLADPADPDMLGYFNIAGTPLYHGLTTPTALPYPTPDLDEQTIERLRTTNWVRVDSPSHGRCAYVFADALDPAHYADLMGALQKAWIGWDIYETDMGAREGTQRTVIRVRGAGLLCLRRLGGRVDRHFHAEESAVAETTS